MALFGGVVCRRSVSPHLSAVLVWISKALPLSLSNGPPFLILTPLQGSQGGSF